MEDPERIYIPKGEVQEFTRQYRVFSSDPHVEYVRADHIEELEKAARKGKDCAERVLKYRGKVPGNETRFLYETLSACTEALEQTINNDVLGPEKGIKHQK